MNTVAAEWREWPMGWTLEEVKEATKAQTVPAGALTFDAVCTDSRRVRPGSLFVALRGSHYDGHRFAGEALRKGALAVLVEHAPLAGETARTFVVPDTLRALGDLAAWTRRRAGLTVVGVTGSNGKTTTKEMIAAICESAARHGPPAGVLKTEGTENNLIGLPKTLLRLSGQETVAVLEMGMNAPQEIARLTEIADPDVGVVTNIGPAHLEGLGSVAGVAAAKAELIDGMRPQAILVANGEDERVRRIAASFRGRRIDFGVGCAVQARAVRDFGFDGIAFDLVIGQSAAPVRLRMPGRHNLANALAAAAAGDALRLSVDTIAAGLEAATPPPMRTHVMRLANGITILNDGYNGNPASMHVALRMLGQWRGRKVAVLGEMRELGAHSADLHYCLGQEAAECGVSLLVAMGMNATRTAAGAREAGMEPSAVHVVHDPAEAAAAVVAAWRSGDAVLLKGSRGPDTEEVVRVRGARMAEVARLLGEAGARP